MVDDTQGRFHVLTLTEGERVRIQNRGNPERNFAIDYLDIAVVPADFGPYMLINEGVGQVTVHKTLKNANA